MSPLDELLTAAATETRASIEGRPPLAMPVPGRRASGAMIAVASAALVSLVFSTSLLVRSPTSRPAIEPSGTLEAPVSGLPTDPILEVRMLPGGALSPEQLAWREEQTGIPGFMASSVRVAAVYPEESERYDVLVWEQSMAASAAPDGTPIVEYPDLSTPSSDMVLLVCASAPLASFRPGGIACDLAPDDGQVLRLDPSEGTTILPDLGDAVAVVFENELGEAAVVYPADGVAMVSWPHRTDRITILDPDGTIRNAGELGLESANDREAAIVAETSPEALFQRRNEAKFPPVLGEAFMSIDDDAKAGLDGLSQIPYDSGSLGEGLRFETVAFSSSGRGGVLISFQDWPETVDPEVLVLDEVEDLGSYQVSWRSDPLTPAVSVFDGSLAVWVYAWHEPSFSVDEARALAVALFEHLTASEP